jgi:uncharacterized membrane protein YfcA
MPWTDRSTLRAATEMSLVVSAAIAVMAKRRQLQHPPPPGCTARCKRSPPCRWSGWPRGRGSRLLLDGQPAPPPVPPLAGLSGGMLPPAWDPGSVPGLLGRLLVRTKRRLFADKASSLLVVVAVAASAASVKLGGVAPQA